MSSEPKSLENGLEVSVQILTAYTQWPNDSTSQNAPYTEGGRCAGGHICSCTICHYKKKIDDSLVNPFAGDIIKIFIPIILTPLCSPG
jgi:hypothetical protein